eukprot:Pgem_evm1s4593
MSTCIYEDVSSFFSAVDTTCTIANNCLLSGEHTISSGDDCWNVLGGTLKVQNGFKGSIKTGTHAGRSCSVTIASGVDLDYLINGGCTVEAESGVTIHKQLLNAAGSMTGHGFELKSNAENDIINSSGNMNVQFLPGSKIERLTVSSGSAVVTVEEVKTVILSSGSLTLTAKKVGSVDAASGTMVVNAEKIDKAQSVGIAKITVNTNDADFESKALGTEAITKGTLTEGQTYKSTVRRGNNDVRITASS